MRIFYSALAMLSLLLPAASAMSHHSFSAEFDVGRPVEITGTIVEVEWTNPHAWFHLDVEGDEGNIERWAVEMLGINALFRGGITPETVKIGDVLTFKGYGARNGSNTANASLMVHAGTGKVLWSSAAR